MENIINNNCYLETTCVRGRSKLTQMINIPPTKFIAPESHAAGALCFIANYGGGMLGGDNVSLNIKIGCNSGLVLLPQANSRAYTNKDGKTASQHMHITVHPGGKFIYNADPLVLHAKSKYLQNTEIKLHDNAGAIIVDWFSIGRSENGEVFLFSEYLSTLKAESPISTFLIDKQYFRPEDFTYNIAGAFAEFSQMLNIFFLGTTTDIATQLEKTNIFQENPDYIFSFTHHTEYTILRMLGSKRQDLQIVLNLIYTLIKSDAIIGFDALIRKM